jgi:hypothetical protein
MQALAKQLFELQPPGGLFDDTTIRNARPDLSDKLGRIRETRPIWKQISQ